jgi:hypothetical protein
MRVLVAACLLAALPTAAVAQNNSYLAVVADEVRMRAGQSDSYADAGTLHRGTRVLVDHEEPGGWLAIQAPPGSVSWVQMTFLEFDKSKPLPQNAAVVEDVTLVAGRVGHAQPIFEVRRAKVPAGSILTVIGEKAVVEGKTWYPVAPPAGDFRYIPKSAVHAERAVSDRFVVRTNDTSNPTAAPPAGGTPLASIPAPAGGLPTGANPSTGAGVNHPLWAQAEAAERAGKYAEAESLLWELAAKMNEPGGDRDVANLCFNRVHSIRAKQRGTTTTAIATRDDRAALPPSASIRPTLGPPPTKDTKPAAATPQAGGEWSKSMMLRRANIAIGGQQTYALESSPGIISAYVVGAPGLELERFKNRRVVVFGTKSTRGMNTPVITATAVDPDAN